MNKMDRRDIFNLFVKSFDEQDFRVISGLNPCIIIYKEQRYNVYIKNLTPAQLSNNNPDVWRCQLPKRPIFSVFKNSEDLFLLLGYDAANDVYATWNPYWAKQRLNVGESVSMYSRYSIQEKASRFNEIIKYDLNHNGSVIVFPRLLLPLFLDNISDYFSEVTQYIAVGSSLRKNKTKESDMNKAEELFQYFSNPNRIDDFIKFLKDTYLSEKTQKSYARYIEFVLERDFFNKYKYIFLKYGNILDYKTAVEEFCSTDEIAYIDRQGKGGWHGAIKAAMKYYYMALFSSQVKREEDKSEEDKPDEVDSEEELTLDDLFDLPEEVADDYDARKESNDIEKPNITTPDLLEKLLPLMCQEEPNELEALQIIDKHFGDTYKDSMKFLDWVNLLRSINWANYSDKPANTNHQIVEDSKESKQTILKVRLSDGTEIYKNRSIDTYVETIEHLFPDLILETGITLRRAPLVSKERFNDRQIKLKDGYYLSVCSHTKDLAEVLQKVAEALGEHIEIEIVSKKTIVDKKIEASITPDTSKNEIETMPRSGLRHFFIKKGNGSFGEGVYDKKSNMFTLLAGSKIYASYFGSFNHKNIYDELTKFYCKYEEPFYILMKDYSFSSPSTAASIILGRSSNGWQVWKDEFGNSLDDIYR
jgi:hypothetical protein